MIKKTKKIEILENMDALIIHAKTKIKLLNRGEKLHGRTEPHIYLYVENEKGRYEITNGRLYYREKLTDSFVKKSTAIISELKILEAVVLWSGNIRHTYAFTWSDFMTWLGLIK